MAAGCDGEDEESEAFDNCATCGMGWTENRLCYEDDPAGLYVEENINPLEMYWDPVSKKRNLKDRRYHIRAKRMPLEEAREMFPGTKDDPIYNSDLDAGWAIDEPSGYRRCCNPTGATQRRPANIHGIAIAPA